MPTVDHIGISRRISDEEERRRLREILETLVPQGVVLSRERRLKARAPKTLRSMLNS